MLGIGIGIGRRRDLIVPDGGGPAGPSVNAVLFDGTNDHLSRDAGLTGAVDGENFLLSLWFEMLGGDGVGQSIVIGPLSRISLSRESSNKIGFFIRTAAAAQLWNWSSDLLFNVATNPGWNHLLLAGRFDVTPVAHAFMNDVALAITEITAPTNGDIDWTETDLFVGANDGSSRMNGNLSEVYLTDEFLDISVESNRRKFIGSDLKPVDLGTGGITPTGTAALVFFSGATVDWHTNKGTAGGFTETGALTDSATSPSD